jgi:hypothetical protein
VRKELRALQKVDSQIHFQERSQIKPSFFFKKSKSEKFSEYFTVARRAAAHQETCHLRFCTRTSRKVEKLKRNLDLKKSSIANSFSGGRKHKDTLFFFLSKKLKSSKADGYFPDAASARPRPENGGKMVAEIQTIVTCSSMSYFIRSCEGLRGVS